MILVITEEECHSLEKGLTSTCWSAEELGMKSLLVIILSIFMNKWTETIAQEGNNTDGVCPELSLNTCPDGIKIGCCSNKFCKNEQIMNVFLMMVFLIFIAEDTESKTSVKELAKKRVCPSIAPIGCLQGYFTECCNNDGCFGNLVCCHITWRCSISCMAPLKAHIGNMRPFNASNDCAPFKGIKKIFNID
ncbi:hypothetical protein NPIL_78331 [Nephila pilipes]|uniref:WAP domain-containing protein n=1 Tax=Nephila pilipes TaxID=299642 RepID=A0A8X6Q2U9_NEPPI|nr:hypothetical protein NPIL_78331 [Nephila pilipes]